MGYSFWLGDGWTINMPISTEGLGMPNHKTKDRLSGLGSQGWWGFFY